MLHLVLMHYGYNGKKFKIRYFDFKKLKILNFEVEIYNIFI